jgi:hypothetical protein
MREDCRREGMALDGAIQYLSEIHPPPEGGRIAPPLNPAKAIPVDVEHNAQRFIRRRKRWTVSKS